MKELEYPFDAEYILKKRKAIKKELIAQCGAAQNGKPYISKRIAILGGSTTHDIKEILELFLLNAEITPVFYESEYNQYWQDVMFDNPELIQFHPDIIFIHTSTRNIKDFPTVRNTNEQIEELLEAAYQPYEQMWNKIENVYQCPVIQNNFEPPFYRLLGNSDFSDSHGRLNFINRLNAKFAAYAQAHNNFYINDINYMASCYGLQKWADPFYWHMYKYACALQAIPELTYNIANVIKSIYGKNQKAFVLDLDNTLWGGVVGDDGADNIEIGQESSIGQLYSEFQEYLKAHKDLGVLLTIDSKNDEENALAGLNRPDSVLKPEDFLIIKANWENKDKNIIEIARELNIGTDSLVFVDDNPAERHIVESQAAGVKVPEVEDIVKFITTLDRAGYFEVTNLSADDLQRNDMYKANVERKKQEASYADYADYLLSLDMDAEIQPFAPMYMARIAQLTNKSNQFNLTTKRCSQADIEGYAQNPSYITLYGKLVDKFGDNGVVSVVFGHIDEADETLFHIDLWLMSCRVLKRDMEYAMMDELVARCQKRGIYCIKGYYYPTAKNAMVRDFYALQGFTKVNEDIEGNAEWEFVIPAQYEKRNKVIQVNKERI
ncbi:MAG: HAD-IIIC family phosphatase [Bacillus sp. (in: Bacteria)]|nr:HAD-IIIC family phosphatase [Bacillus sp. (in: firmicutes)]MCM1425269.1 HAD-IIIC family phosphatase [Eubacterium sp.]